MKKWRTNLEDSILNRSNAFDPDLSVSEEFLADCDVKANLRFEEAVFWTFLDWICERGINLLRY